MSWAQRYREIMGALSRPRDPYESPRLSEVVNGRRPKPIDGRPLVGVPSVFTGTDTTYGEQRRMAREIRDETWNTAVEKGLAISLLAIIDDFEWELFGPQKDQ